MSTWRDVEGNIIANFCHFQIIPLLYIKVIKNYELWRKNMDDDSTMMSLYFARYLNIQDGRTFFLKL